MKNESFLYYSVVSNNKNKRQKKRRENQWRNHKRSRRIQLLKWRLLFLQLFKCYYCKRYIFPHVKWLPFTREREWTATYEHKKRIIDGGTDDHTNICMACKKCNNIKGSWDSDKKFNTMYNALKDGGIIEE